MYLQNRNKLTDIEKKFMATKGESVSHSVVSDSLQPHGPGLLCSWNSSGKNSRVGSHSLLQRIFPTQGSNSGLL